MTTGSWPSTSMLACRSAVISSGSSPSMSTELVRTAEDQGRHQRLLPDHLDVEGLGGAAGLAANGHAHRQHVGLAAEPAGDAGADVGVDDADRLQRRAHLEADTLPRIDRVDVAGHQRELAPAQAQERMAPAVDAVALDVRHGADAGQVEVAGDQGDRQRPARPPAACLSPPRRPAPRRRRPASAPCRRRPGSCEAVSGCGR